jgi:transcriptional regulator with XRE-family HTH domain
MNSSPKPNVKRKRGIALSASGWRRLNRAIHATEAAENAGKRFTAEELSRRTGISASTLSRLWSAKSGCDRRTLALLFNAFKLDLLDSDLQPVMDDTEPSLLGSQAGEILTPPPISYPSGPVAVDSTRYISRPQVDDLALQEILQPGCVIRIKAPSGFGKTSFILRLLHRAQQLGYATAGIDLQQSDPETLADSRSFLRWMCTVLARKLELDLNLEHYWDDLLGSKLSTTLYLQEGILLQLRQPLVFVLNKVEQIFEYPNTAKSLFPLLRSWHEEAQHNDVWQQLRLIVAYSTDAYLPLDINQSPFNIGLPLSLPELNREQVQQLADLWSVSWSEDDCDRLLGLIGGNPALVSLALYHLHQGMSLEALLQAAYTLEGIYRNQLQHLFAQVNAHPQWLEQLELLTKGDGAITLDPLLAYKLEGIGLIQSAQGGWRLSCELYRAAFRNYLFNR